MVEQQQPSAQSDDDGEEKIVRAVRTTRELWNDYGKAVTAQGTDRAKHLNAYMRYTVRKYAKERSAPDG